MVNRDEISKGAAIYDVEHKMVAKSSVLAKSADSVDMPPQKSAEEKLADALQQISSRIGVNIGETPSVTGESAADAIRDSETSPSSPEALPEGSAEPRPLRGSSRGVIEPSANSAENISINTSELQHADDDAQEEMIDSTYSTQSSPGGAVAKNESPEFRSATMEQIRRGHVSNVLSKMDGSAISFDEIRRDDDKDMMLEEIDSLLETLKADEVDTSRVPKVTRLSDSIDIESVLKILRLKNDRKRYCSIAEDVMLFGAAGLGYIFDGEREYFGRRPNMKGYDNSLRVKLRRMRHDTSTVISDLMHDMNMSAGARILLELVPSMLLYGYQHSGTKEESETEDKKEAENHLRDTMSKT
jgi:hypothetical protein